MSLPTDPGVVALAVVAFVVVTIALIILLRRLIRARAISYAEVNHGLDEEEEAFKKTLEMQGDDIDALFSFSGQDELEFDLNEVDQLEMLEVYRNNLVASAESLVETGLGKEEGAAKSAPEDEPEETSLLSGDSQDPGPQDAEKNGMEQA